MGSTESTTTDDASVGHGPAGDRGGVRSIRCAAVAIVTHRVLTLLLAILLTVAAAPGFDGGMLPGIAGAIVPVGGPHRALASEQAVLPAERALTLSVDGRTWSPLLSDLGITYEAPGSGGGHAVMIPGSLRFDGDRFDAYLDRIDDELEGRAIDAAVNVDGVDIEIVPARDGWVIDRGAVTMTLLVQVIGGEPVVIPLPVRHGPATITTEDAEATKALIDGALARPYIVKLGDQQWTVAPERLAAALRVERDGDGGLTATLNTSGADALVSEIAADIDSGPSDAWVQDLGTHQWLVPSERGRTLHREALIQSFESAIANEEHMIELAVTEKGSPRVTTEQLMTEMGITDLIATGDSEFAGSGAGRAHNVVQAAYMIDGTLIPSGGSFSFNDAVGSLFSGKYTEAGSFIDGPSGQSLAGGVCQVSTTVFRAALEAGLPIVEWWPHSYRSPFYESGGWSPGFDASIVQDGDDPAASADFRFANTTDSWLLVRSVASRDGTLRVELHGADPGYQVEFEEPIVEVIEEAPATVDVVVDDALPPETVLPLQPAMDGLQVTVIRRVLDADGEVLWTDSFVSSYRAYAAVRRVSPDMD